MDKMAAEAILFPAPREVDRELYGVPEENIPKRVLKFPAPREVGR